MNLLQNIKQGNITDSIKKVAKDESIDVDQLLAKLSLGTCVIPRNNKGRASAIGIGEGLSTKINANLGTSMDVYDIGLEKNKLQASVAAGADTVMDLSCGPEISKTMQELIKDCDIPFGTVPVYQATVKSQEANGNFVNATADDFLSVIKEQAKLGVDFMTIHAGVNKDTVNSLVESDRLMDVVSRGGSLTIAWMVHNDKENPYYEHFDKVLDIAAEYDVTISLGDGMRPGSIVDASDKAQIHELTVLGDLVKKCRDANVQAIVEGPGHVPIDQIEANVLLQKRICSGAPFYVLGPLVTDIAPGYDHITGAIGGAIAAAAGADFLCYVTPSEHLSLPTVEDVVEGIMASKIAAHSADIVKNVSGAIEKDYRMSEARKALDWKKQAALSINPDKAREYLSRKPQEEDACTMCGPYCAMKLISEYLGKGYKSSC